MSLAIQQVLDQHVSEFEEFDRLREQFNFHSNKKYSQTWRSARDHRAGMELHLIEQKMVGKGGHAHISKIAAACRKLDDAHHQNWLKNTHLECEDGTKIGMAEVAKTAHQKAAKLCAILTGIDRYAKHLGLIEIATTITLPPRFHSNPSNGHDTWDGSAPRDGHDCLQNCWGNFGRRNGKILGFRAVESQEDGTEHWHMLHFVKDIEKFKSEILRHFHTESDRQIKFDELGEGATAKASSYIMKYAFKSIGAGFEGVDRPVDHEKHWRYLWAVRGYQFSGLPKGALTIWDEMRRIKKPSFGGCALYAWAAADQGDFCEFLEQLKQAEENGQKIELSKSRRPSGTTKIEGLKIGIAKIETHIKKWVRVTVKSSMESTSGELRTINQGTRCGGRGLRPSHRRGKPLPLASGGATRKDKKMGLRNKEIKIRLTGDEHAELKSKSGRMRLAAWMRESCIRRMPPTIPPINLEALAQLRGAAANLNQLTKHANQIGGIPELISLGELVSEFRAELLGAKESTK